MKDLKALQLFQEVLAKTRARKVEWSQRSSNVDEETYMSSLPNGRELIVGVEHLKNSWGDDLGEEYTLSLQQNGVDLLRVTQDVDQIQDSDLKELFDLSRRQALGVDATVDQVLGDLANL